MSITFDVTPGLKPKRFELGLLEKVGPRDCLNTAIFQNKGYSESVLAREREYASKIKQAQPKVPTDLKTVEAWGGPAQVLQWHSQRYQGLYDACSVAFANHWPLEITPDSVWLTLVQGFSTFVAQNAEAVRKQVVEFEGKKTLEIIRNEFIKGKQNDWANCFGEWAQQVKHNTKPKTYERIVSEFTTTTPLDLAVSHLLLLDATKSYFGLRCCTMCGIPRVTLRGTVADWKKIRAKADSFAEYGLGWWRDALMPVLSELVLTAEGYPKADWWQSFFKLNSMSGGDTVTGHINAFFPYIQQQPYRTSAPALYSRSDLKKDWKSIKADEVPSGLACVPFEWKYYTTTFPMEFRGGLALVSLGEEGTVRPEPVWSVMDAGVQS